MRTRDSLILVGALGLCAAAGLVLMTQESFAVELPPGGPAAAAPAAVPAAAPNDAAEAEAAPTSPGRAVPVEATARAADAGRTETTGWTKGILRGDIQLAVSVLDRIESITVAVEEARQPTRDDGSFHPPYRMVVPVRRGVGTPTFEVRDVPFSEYPYVVSVYAPGLNGTRRTVTVDASSPLVDDIVLAITPGSPFSVLLRDQDAAPYAGLEVKLLPVGEPLGRRASVGTSDNFGSVVFEDMLAGDYQLAVSLGGQPIGDVQTITVQSGRANFQAGAQHGQGYTVTIPRGLPQTVQVSDVAGYGVADATVTATAADRVRLTVLEATTDYGGKAEFAHLTPGMWQLDVDKDGFQRSHLMVKIQAGQLPTPQQVRLVRLR
ncbi:MAG: hypothetical protein JNM25_13435 [Planctomycetes bacterium]|nr:hypothetical protein [Planctomycetota bacterium]